jgi:hypothetical protein
LNLTGIRLIVYFLAGKITVDGRLEKVDRGEEGRETTEIVHGKSSMRANFFVRCLLLLSRVRRSRRTRRALVSLDTTY